MDKRETERLLVRREELRDRLKAIAADIGRGFSADSEERATELENVDVLEEIARVTRMELDRVEREIEGGRAVAGEA